MTQAIFVINAGSSSLKFAIYRAEAGTEPLATGAVERIGPDGRLHLNGSDGAELPTAPGPLATHGQALETALESIRRVYPALSVAAFGHRVVHGGLAFDAPVRVTDDILATLREFVPFAPLHQSHNLAGIEAARQAFPNAPQVACFDTAFHRSHPFVNDTFALPRAYYDKGVRRYGFHGLSYEYISSELAARAPDLAAGRVVVAHLGNGASMCALKGGVSVASTMGFSALDGLPMGTRCGQLDPGVVLYLLTEEGLSPAAASDLLYRQSGLLGLSGLSNDMRELEASDAPEARDAIDYFTFRIRRELGAMSAALGGLDALVFCGGIGENSVRVREEVCAPMGWLGVHLDRSANAGGAGVISPPDAPVAVMVIPTNEELVIARAAHKVWSAAS